MYPIQPRSIFILLILTCVIHTANAQGITISQDTAAIPEQSALLDLQSDGQGFLAPRMSESQRNSISSPATGLLIYQTDGESGFFYFNGIAWQPINEIKGVFEDEFEIGQKDPNLDVYMMPNSTFGDFLYDTSGIITDDGGLNANYSDNVNGKITIFGPDFFGDQIALRLQINTLNLHESDTLSITIYSGPNLSQTLKYTNQSDTVLLPFSTEFAVIKFKSDGAFNDEGFEIRFDWMYLQEQPNAGSNEHLGWYFEPSLGAMRGGINFVDAWQYDSLGRASFSYGQNLKVTGAESVAFGENNRVAGAFSGAIGKGNRIDDFGSFSYGQGNVITGRNSFAGGISSTISGSNAVALGESEANGDFSVALGNSRAQNQYTFAVGEDNVAEGANSVAFGLDNWAEAQNTFVAGFEVRARSRYETVFGRYNIQEPPISTAGWAGTDPLFVVGNGDSFNAHNALTILKNGHLGIGIHAPQYPLHVTAKDGFGVVNIARFENTATSFSAISINTQEDNPLTMSYDGLQGNLQFTRSSATPFSLNWNLDPNGRVGIGTIQPQSKLHVNGRIRVDDGIMGGNNGLSLLSSDGTNRFTLLDNGNIGIGIANPDTKLEVSGWIKVSQGIQAANGTGLAFTTDDGFARLMIKDDGKIGIGTVSPNTQLHVAGHLTVDDVIQAADVGGLSFRSDDGTNRLVMHDDGRIGIGNNSPDAQLAVSAQGTNDALRIRTPAGTKFRIFNNGNVRIGQNSGTTSSQLNINSLATVSPIQAQVDGATKMMVHTNGGVSIGSSTAPDVNGIRVAGSYAAKSGGGSWTATSDIRLKKVHGTYSDGLSEVLKIHPIRYSYNEKSGYDTSETHIGVIAQELKQIAPYMIGSFEQDGDDYLTVDNSAMIYMLINAVKEQQEMIDRQAKLIQKLQEKIGG